MRLAAGRRRCLLPLVCALLVGTGGCSFLFMESVSTAADPSRAPHCTPNNATVIADAVFGAAYLSSAGAYTRDSGDDERRAAAFGVALGAVLAVSAIMHMDDADKCRRAIDAHNQWVISGGGR